MTYYASISLAFIAATVKKYRQVEILSVKLFVLISISNAAALNEGHTIETMVINATEKASNGSLNGHAGITESGHYTSSAQKKNAGRYLQWLHGPHSPS